MRYLRKNTAVIVSVGPFYDKTDGVTIETGLTITNERITLVADTDDGSAPTNILDNVTGATSGTDNDLNYIANNDAGMMQLELTAANTNRNGRLLLSITDAANHVPVFHEFTILPANVYDALIAGTDSLEVDTTAISGTAQTARDIGASVLLSSGTGTGQVSLSSGAVLVQSGTGTGQIDLTSGQVKVQQGSGAGQLDTASGRVLVQTGTGSGQLSLSSGVIAANVTQFGGAAGTFASGVPSVKLANGVAHGGTTATLELGSSTSWALKVAAGTADEPAALFLNTGSNGRAISIVTNGADSQALYIDATSEPASSTTSLYVGAGLTLPNVNAVLANAAHGGAAATLTLNTLSVTSAGITSLSGTEIDYDTIINVEALTANAKNGVADAVWDEALSGHATAGTAGAALSAATAPTAAAVADAVWDELLSGHVISGSAGAALAAAQSAGDPWSTSLPGAYGSGTAGYIMSSINTLAGQSVVLMQVRNTTQE